MYLLHVPKKYLKNDFYCDIIKTENVCMNVSLLIYNIVGGVYMATSSITKEFTVKDVNAYSQMVKEVSSKPERTVKTVEPSNIERGNNLLKQFSFR